MSEPTRATLLPKDTKVRSIGLHPSALDYSRLPEGYDEASLTARIEKGIAAFGEAGSGAAGAGVRSRAVW